MAKPLTYLSLKAVFQCMEVKRLELNSHCPALRSAESSVPLNLQSLSFEKEKIVANDVCYKVESKSQGVKTILEGRRHIRAEILKIHDLSVIPDSQKFITRNLDSGDIDLERVLPFINRSSRPLRELRVNISKTPNLEKYLGFTQTLILFVSNYNGEMEELVRTILLNRECPNIVLENIDLSRDTTAALIQNWKDNRKKDGTVLTMQNGFRILPMFSLYVDVLRDVLNGYMAYLDDSVLQNKMGRRCVSFPFNNWTSEVVLYSVRDGPNGKRRTKLEVMPIGSTGPGTLVDDLKELLIFFSIFVLFILTVGAIEKVILLFF